MRFLELIDVFIIKYIVCYGFVIHYKYIRPVWEYVACDGVENLKGVSVFNIFFFE